MTQKYRPKKRYKIKYKNLAILLAILLIIILLISKGCSAIFKNKDDKEKQKEDSPLVTGDLLPDSPPPENLNTDPTKQSYYLFTPIEMTQSQLGSGNLVLVNNNIRFLGSVTEDDLDVVREKKNRAYSVKDYTVLVQPVVMDALNDMFLSFYEATGKDTVMVNAGYRTLEYQQQLYDEELARIGADSSTLVAKAGDSEHHTGLAVDFTVYEGGKYDQSKLGTGDYAWIDENAHKFGFVNRYPKGKESITLIDNEPWHYRYVGVPHATAMKDYDLCLEQYIDYIKNYTIDSGFLSVTTDDGAQYMIYYTPMSEAESTSVYIPLKEGADTPDDSSDDIPYPYEISGNNIDGFIVTFRFKEGTGLPQVADPATTTSPDENAEPKASESGEE